jgi:cell division protein FtsQ
VANQRIPRLPELKKKKKRGGKLIFILLLFFITLFVVLFFRSSISKVDKIEILGNQYIEHNQVGQALGLKVGDSFFSASAGNLKKRVLKLPNVESVSVVKRFPGHIRIKIKEFNEVAYVVGNEGKMNVLLSNGNEVIPISGNSIKLMPVLSGWEDYGKNRKKLCQLLRDIPQTLLSDISQISPDPSVSYPDRIRMYTRSQFEVITSIAYLPNKIEYMRAIIGGGRDPGEIVLLEADTYRSYESMYKPADEYSSDSNM